MYVPCNHFGSALERHYRARIVSRARGGLRTTSHASIRWRTVSCHLQRHFGRSGSSCSRCSNFSQIQFTTLTPSRTMCLARKKSRLSYSSDSVGTIIPSLTSILHPNRGPGRKLRIGRLRTIKRFRQRVSLPLLELIYTPSCPRGLLSDAIPGSLPGLLVLPPSVQVSHNCCPRFAEQYAPLGSPNDADSQAADFIICCALAL